MASTHSPVPGHSPPPQAFAVIALGIVAVSLGAIFIRLAQDEGMPSLFIAAARMSIATVVLTPVVLRRHGVKLRAQLVRRDLIWMLIAGIFLAAHFATWILSLEYTGVLVSVALVNTNPLWAALIETVLLRQAQSKWVRMALLLGLVGSIVVAIPAGGQISLGKSPFLGSILALIGAATVAVYFVIGKQMRNRLPLMVYIWLVYGTAAIVLVLLVIINHILISGYSTQGYVWLIALALVPQLIGHTSLNFALKYLPATYVGITVQLEPAISAIAAFFVFSEVPFSLHIAGSAVILVGVALASLVQSRGR